MRDARRCSFVKREKQQGEKQRWRKWRSDSCSEKANSTPTRKSPFEDGSEPTGDPTNLDSSNSTTDPSSNLCRTKLNNFHSVFYDSTGQQHFLKPKWFWNMSTPINHHSHLDYRTDSFGWEKKSQPALDCIQVDPNTKRKKEKKVFCCLFTPQIGQFSMHFFSYLLTHIWHSAWSTWIY